MLKTFDIFISGATEDKEVVNALWESLSANGLKVACADHGSHTPEEIKAIMSRGLKNSRYGLALISPHYNSQSPGGELLSGAIGKERLIPVLHHLSLEDAAARHAGIEDMHCLDTAYGIDNLSNHISRIIRPASYGLPVLSGTLKKYAVRFLLILGLLLISISCIYAYRRMRPSELEIKTAIQARASEMLDMARNDLQRDLVQNNGYLSTADEIRLMQKQILSLYPEGHHQNRVYFTNGRKSLNSLQQVLKAGIVNDIHAPFGLVKYRLYVFQKAGDADQCLSYALYNLQPLHYEVLGSKLKDGRFEVDVRYANNLRYAGVTIEPDEITHTSLNDIRLLGFEKRETLVLGKKDDGWILLEN